MKLHPSPAHIHAPTLKPPRPPDGFVLIQDTREQKPLYGSSSGSGGFGSGLLDGLRVSTKTLVHGDYSIWGYENLFAVERKQISDFYSYIGKERKRTTRKMEQFRDMASRGGWVGLVVEASESDLLTGYVMSKVPPEVARQALVSFEVRYGVHTFYSRSRYDIARWVVDRAIKFYRIQQEDIP